MMPPMYTFPTYVCYPQRQLKVHSTRTQQYTDDEGSGSSEEDSEEDSAEAHQAEAKRLSKEVRDLECEIRDLKGQLIQKRSYARFLVQEQYEAVQLGYPELLVPGYKLDKKGKVPSWLRQVHQYASFGGFLLNISKADFEPKELLLISGHFLVYA